MNKEEIAKYIYDYAVEHYNDGGWDVIVECWTLNQIMEHIEDGESKEDALKHFESVVAVWADQEADAVNSAW
jgi:hypothetical protein